MRPARSLWTAAPALFLALLAARLLDPSRVLAVRDFATFHLPLRASLLRLLEAGAPEWNPWIGGGQPVLSDPSYSAFYPATWLGLLLPLGWGFSLAAALHLALAAAGGFVLARRLGARPAVAAFAAVAWSGSGALLSNFHAYTLLAGGAWIPWILVAVDSGERATEARARRRAGLWLALALALPVLNGEPVTVLCGGLAAGCFAVARSGGRERLKSLGRVASAALLAAALAGIQLVPAIARLADTRRAGGLSRDEALTWSMPPARAIELVEPRAFGDPMRMEDGLYFGWGIQDRDFPFLFSLYASLLALALASVALARWPIPRRGAWTLMAALGIVLALGRFTPIDPFLHDHVPPFSAVRYPEKFFLLTGLALAFAAALGLEHLLREREAGRFRAANLPLALGGLLAGAALALGTL
ncbi:MAG TPA: hypothetical protein VLA66_12625, partial [Thermoanaerobaculia bacterium]|nr:hypothetical protein [Thermoanaerobaculia bacterium]